MAMDVEFICRVCVLTCTEFFDIQALTYLTLLLFVSMPEFDRHVNSRNFSGCPPLRYIYNLDTSTTLIHPKL